MAYLICNNCKTENKARVFEAIRFTKKPSGVLRYFVLQADSCTKCKHTKRMAKGLVEAGFYEELGYLKSDEFASVEANSLGLEELDELPEEPGDLKVLGEKVVNDKCFKIIVGEATVKMAHNTI